jgi:hypothetical protein
MECISVILIHRHGARMPTKYVNGSNIWPNNDLFWQANSLSLTPTGIYQAINLGKYMNTRYPYIKEAKCIATNTNRSIMTAWAMYDGMMPDTPIYFSSIGDKILRTNAVNIIIDVDNKIIGHRENDIQHVNNIINYPKILEIFNNKEIKNITRKFYKTTNITGFSPEATLRQNVEALLLVMSNIKTYISNSQSIKNDFNVILTDAELDKLINLSNLFGILKYTPYDDTVLLTNNIVSAVIKKLNLSVLNIFKSAIKNNNIIFNSFSCHDSELLALASSMGLILDEGTNFTSYFLFELLVVDGEYIVAVYYNDGLLPSIDNPKYWKRQQESKNYYYWSELPTGYFKFAEFEIILLSGLC